jgi:hypothetical protein
MNSEYGFLKAMKQTNSLAKRELLRKTSDELLQSSLFQQRKNFEDLINLKVQVAALTGLSDSNQLVTNSHTGSRLAQKRRQDLSNNQSEPVYRNETIRSESSIRHQFPSSISEGHQVSPKNTAPSMRTPAPTHVGALDASRSHVSPSSNIGVPHSSLTELAALALYLREEREQLRNKKTEVEKQRKEDTQKQAALTRVRALIHSTPFAVF